MITPSRTSSVSNNVTNHDTTAHHDQSQPAAAAAASKKKRNLPGNPDPEAEVVALSPRSLMSTNRFVCEICSKGFQRDQNLQLHRRGHNLPWKLKQRAKQDMIKKKVYVCPEPACVHHDPSRALGDLTGIKKHFSRKHGEKKWKCEKCSKRYAVQSDWRAHSKICGTREYRCDCGTIFSRRDSFITHRAFCDALAEESARSSAHHLIINPPSNQHLHLHLQTPSILPPKGQLTLQQEHHHSHLIDVIDHINYDHHLRQTPQHAGSFVSISSSLSATTSSSSSSWLDHHQNPNPMYNPTSMLLLHNAINPSPSAHLSATALLQKAADQMGVTSMTKPRPGASGGGGHELTISTGSQSSTLAGLGANLQAPHMSSAALASSSTTDHDPLLQKNRSCFVHVNPAGCMDQFGVCGTTTTTYTTAAATTSTPPPLFHHHADHHIANRSNSLSSAATDNYGLDQAAGSTFGDAYSNGIFLGSKTSFQEAPQRLSIINTSTTTTRSREIGHGNDEMTRDFLGLRGFNPRDPFLNMASLDHITTPSPSTYPHHQNDHSQTSWQG